MDTIEAWWQQHGADIAEPTEGVAFGYSLRSSSPERELGLFWDVFRHVIVPNLPRRAATVERALGFMDRLKQLNLPTGSALPATLWLRTDRVEAVASDLRREFANPSQVFYLSALRGLVFWARCSSTSGFDKANRLPPPPVDLLRELGAAVAFRRPDALAYSLDAAYHVLRRIGRRRRVR